MTENSTATTTDNPGVVARPPLIYLGALLIALVLRRLWPMPLVGRPVAVWLGVAGIAVGVATAIWGRRTMRAAGTNINPSRPATTIVDAGPFRYSRNPLYLALTLIYLGLTVAFDTWWGIVMFAPLALVMHRGVVRREERYLDRKFGASYQQYRSTVRRYL